MLKNKKRYKLKNSRDILMERSCVEQRFQLVEKIWSGIYIDSFEEKL